MHTGVTQCWDGKYLRAVEGPKSVATGKARKIKITICQTESNSNGCANCLRGKKSLCDCPLTFVQRRSRDGGLEEESPTAPSLHPRKFYPRQKLSPEEPEAQGVYFGCQINVRPGDRGCERWRRPPFLASFFQPPEPLEFRIFPVPYFNQCHTPAGLAVCRCL